MFIYCREVSSKNEWIASNMCINSLLLFLMNAYGISIMWHYFSSCEQSAVINKMDNVSCFILNKIIQKQTEDQEQ